MFKIFDSQDIAKDLFGFTVEKLRDGHYIALVIGPSGAVESRQVFHKKEEVLEQIAKELDFYLEESKELVSDEAEKKIKYWEKELEKTEKKE